MPPKKQRPNNFFEVGVQGRKTGITLQDTGVRDENGLEPLDGIFSSPAKSPPKYHNDLHDATISVSEDMDVQQSSAPEPEEALSVRKLIRNKTLLPPPRGKSPLKTNIGSSPRRQSMGPPSRRQPSSLEQQSSSPRSVNRKLDFSVNGAPGNDSVITPEHEGGSRHGSKQRRDVYDLPHSPERGQKRTHDESFGEGGVISEPNGTNDSIILGSPEDETPQESLVEDIDVELVEGSGEADAIPQERPDESDIVASSPPQRKTKAGRPTLATTSRPKRKSASQAVKGKRTAKATSNPKNFPKKIAANVSQITEPDVSEVASDEPPKKKRGRPPSKKAVVADASDATLSVRTSNTRNEPLDAGAKKEQSVKSAEKAVANSMPPPVSRGRGRKAKEAENGSNSKYPIDAALGPSAMRGGSVPRADVAEDTKSNVVLRSQTPFDDSFKRSHFGRAIIPPINYYLGERVEYGSDGTLQNIVKAEIAPKQKLQRSAGGRGRGGRREASVFLEADENDLEDWEREEPGVLSGYVNKWDEDEGQETEDLGEMELAMAYRAIRPREVASGDFSYARIFDGFPWFSNGIVKIPPGGSKRPKPSRKMHLVFFVICGHVEVTIGNNRFSINSGGVFQVPRGNTYGIDNSSTREAQLFFTQASQPIMENEG